MQSSSLERIFSSIVCWYYLTLDIKVNAISKPKFSIISETLDEHHSLFRQILQVLTRVAMFECKGEENVNNLLESLSVIGAIHQ